MNSFDYTVCQAAVWFDKEQGKWRSCVGESFYPDLAARRLVYTHPQRSEDVGGSLLRMRKFLSRGYNIQAKSIAGIISRLVGGLDIGRVDIKNEVEVTKILMGILHEVDPLVVIDGIDFIDEHEVL